MIQPDPADCPVVGVDEAGRGPALGSLFAAAVRVADPGGLPDGLADSKRLSADRREALARRLGERDGVAVGVAEVPPDRIDDPATDMNGLTASAQATAVRRAGGGRVVADACDVDADRFARRLSAALDDDRTVAAEHHADESRAVVAAASVVAKVERDAHVARLADEHGAVGSGYPSDPTTRKFLSTYLEANGELPSFARRSWATCRRLVADREQAGVDEF